MSTANALSYLASTGFYNLVLTLLAAELIALVVFRQRTGRGVATGELVTFLGAGGALFLALRLLVAGGSRGLLAVALTVALVCHVQHLRQRWR